MQIASPRRCCPNLALGTRCPGRYVVAKRLGAESGGRHLRHRRVAREPEPEASQVPPEALHRASGAWACNSLVLLVSCSRLQLVDSRTAERYFRDPLHATLI